MSKKAPVIDHGMVQLRLPLSNLPSQAHKAESLRTSGAVKEALRSALDACGLSRDTVADELSRLTGADVSIHTINNWASTAKADRHIPTNMLTAITIVTGDPGVARAALEPAGLAVLSADQVPLYELGRITAEDKARAKQRKALWEKINK